jgi:hypothetical protein
MITSYVIYLIRKFRLDKSSHSFDSIKEPCKKELLNREKCNSTATNSRRRRFFFLKRVAPLDHPVRVLTSHGTEHVSPSKPDQSLLITNKSNGRRPRLQPSSSHLGSSAARRPAAPVLLSLPPSPVATPRLKRAGPSAPRRRDGAQARHVGPRHRRRLRHR